MLVRALPGLREEVIKGGSTGWFGFVETEDGEDDVDGGLAGLAAAGAGEDVMDDESVAMAAVMLEGGK